MNSACAPTSLPHSLSPTLTSRRKEEPAENSGAAVLLKPHCVGEKLTLPWKKHSEVRTGCAALLLKSTWKQEGSNVHLYFWIPISPIRMVWKLTPYCCYTKKKIDISQTDLCFKDLKDLKVQITWSTRSNSWSNSSSKLLKCAPIFYTSADLDNTCFAQIHPVLPEV